jgi:peptide/nickel transport system substrate-binding protein
VLTKYSPVQQAVFTKNENYWGTPAKTDNLIIRYYSKSSTMKLAIQRGEIDMSYQSFTPNEITSLQKQKGVRVYNGAGGRIRYLTMNVTRPPADNVAVRRAVAYLMPRQTIAGPCVSRPGEAALLDGARRLSGSHRRFRGALRSDPNPAKAKATLQAAGVDTPLADRDLVHATHYGDSSADEYAEIKRSLERDGVFSVTLKSSEWAQYSSVLGNQYNVYQLGWFPDYPDSENYLVPFYRNDTFTASGYNSPAMEKLIKLELASKTLAQRIRLIKSIQLLAAKDVPIVPYWQQSMIAWSVGTTCAGFRARSTRPCSCGSGCSRSRR